MLATNVDQMTIIARIMAIPASFRGEGSGIARRNRRSRAEFPARETILEVIKVHADEATFPG
jgi:hypothetical protein